MAKITFTTSGDREIEVEAVAGNLMQAAVANSVPGILGDCGGNASCATCHVHVEDQWVHRVGPTSDAELAMLEFEDAFSPQSRLACQVMVTEELNGLGVRVAANR